MFEGFCRLVLVQGGARGLGFGGYGVLVCSPQRYSRGGIPGSGGLVRTGSGFWVLGVRRGRVLSSGSQVQVGRGNLGSGITG